MTTRRSFVAGGVSLAGALATARLGQRAFAHEATPEADAACPVLNSAEMNALAEGWGHAWGTGDTAYFADHVAEGYVHHSAGLHSALGDVVPLDTVLLQVQEWRKGFPDFAVQVDFTVVDGEYVGYLFTMTGTHTGDYYGIPATNKAIVDTGITVLRVACGKVAESWGAWDRGHFLNQLGLLDLPEPDPADTPATPEAFIEGVCAPGSAADAVAVAQRYWDVVWGAELTDVAQLEGVTSLYVNEHLPYGMPIVGQEALVRRVANWKTCMPDLVYTPVQIFSGETHEDGAIVTGIHAITIWTATGTPTGPLPAIDYAGRADAQPLTWRGSDIYRINCGRVEEVWSEFDMDRLVMAIRGK